MSELRLEGARSRKGQNVARAGAGKGQRAAETEIAFPGARKRLSRTRVKALRRTHCGIAPHSMQEARDTFLALRRNSARGA
jgi:hypothetical protein